MNQSKSIRWWSLVLATTLAIPAMAQDDQKAKPDDLQILKGMLLTPQAFRQAVEKIRPSMVTIESFGGVSALQGQIGGIRRQGEGNTTGVVVSSDGLVITSSFNFIKQPPVITVVTSDGQRRIARLLGRDDTRQICLLKIRDAKDLPVPEMVDPKSVRVGQWAVSVGVGYGDVNPAVSQGIVSAKNRAGGRAIQTDANISPANYGGPLVDIDGRMIGICVPLNPNSANRGAGVEWYDSGIGFAIPMHGLEDLIRQMEQGKNFYPAYLGVVTGPTDDGVGVRIENVDSIEARKKAAAAKRAKTDLDVEEDDDSEDANKETELDFLEYDYPAHAAGLKKGDIILKVDDHQIFDVRQLKITLSKYNAGDQVKLLIRRSLEKGKGDEKKPDDAEKKESADEEPADDDRKVEETVFDVKLGRSPKTWLDDGRSFPNMVPKPELPKQKPELPNQ